MPELLIRPETAADFSAVDQVLRQAFPGSQEARLVSALRRRSGFEPALSLVTTLAGPVVGHVLFTPIVIEGAAATTASLALAPVAVRPAFQRRGVGGRLIEAGLAAARQLGYCSVIVLGHPGYYPRFGFEPAGRWGIEAPFAVPAEAFMALELAPGALTGAAGTVRYPAEFVAA
ncbi:GNAT family N-acetyltransferase [Hymenobacter sp. B81]|uniref:GNAT family N-acetyltransferase n=1 Tax=Hymenobacter sp. B81 TaxID=3344878 RepID=UPI0037DC9529